MIFKVDVNFLILTLSIIFNEKKSINSVAGMVSYTLQFKHKIVKKLQMTVQKGAVCYMLYVLM